MSEHGEDSSSGDGEIDWHMAAGFSRPGICRLLGTRRDGIGGRAAREGIVAGTAEQDVVAVAAIGGQHDPGPQPRAAAVTGTMVDDYRPARPPRMRTATASPWNPGAP